VQHRSGKSEQHLIGPARRRALETYLRFGRTPDGGPGQSEGKAVNQTAATPHAAPVRATRFYVWRTAGDDRVRAGHVQRDGKVFSWSELPAGGHPGSQHNCRCWPEPYYGDPSVPDALQPLHYVQQSDTAGNQLWASIETLTRPDGSLAQSVVVANDGTRFQTSFRATTVNRVVTLPNGQIVRVDTDSGLQSVYLGADSTPLFQSRWTANGPKVVRARQHVAFLLDGD
jgi:hypothetical protein